MHYRPQVLLELPRFASSFFWKFSSNCELAQQELKIDCTAAAYTTWSVLCTIWKRRCWDAAALHRRCECIFTRDWLTNWLTSSIIKFWNTFLITVPKLVVHQVHFLVEHQNDVCCDRVVQLRGEHALRPRRGLLSNVRKHCIHSHQCRSINDWWWGLPATDHTALAVQLWLGGYIRKEHLHPCQQLWLRCRGHPDVVPLSTERLVYQEIACFMLVNVVNGAANANSGFSNSFIHGTSNNNMCAPPCHRVSTRLSCSQIRVMFLTVL